MTRTRMENSNLLFRSPIKTIEDVNDVLDAFLHATDLALAFMLGRFATRQEILKEAVKAYFAQHPFTGEVQPILHNRLRLVNMHKALWSHLDLRHQIGDKETLDPAYLLRAAVALHILVALTMDCQRASQSYAGAILKLVYSRFVPADYVDMALTDLYGTSYMHWEAYIQTSLPDVFK